MDTALFEPSFFIYKSAGVISSRNTILFTPLLSVMVSIPYP